MVAAAMVTRLRVWLPSMMKIVHSISDEKSVQNKTRGTVRKEITQRVVCLSW